MPQKVLRVSVLAARRPPVTRWGNAELRPCAVLPQEPAVAHNTLLTADGGMETWYLGGRDLVLHSGDTSHHKDNLLSGRPSVWVSIRGNDPSTAEVINVTADPYEGEGYASDLDLTVEAVPMPISMRKLVKEFVETHHVEIPFKKRKRQAVDPNAMTSRAPRVLGPDDKWGNRPKRG